MKQHTAQPTTQDLLQNPQWIYETSVEFWTKIGCTPEEAHQLALREIEQKFPGAEVAA